MAWRVNSALRMLDPQACIDLLLVDAEDRAPMLLGVDRMAAADAARPAPRPKPDELWSDEHAPDDLVRQRWGLIAPAGERGDRLIDAIAPLVEHRRRQQGAVAIYRVPPRMTASEAARWKKRVFRTGAGSDDALPRYQLIVGDLDEVPLAIHHVQASDGFVGRLAFDELDGYRSYAAKVIAWEDARPAVAAGDAILHAVRDGTPATRRAYEALIAPGEQLLRQRRAAYGSLWVTGSERPSPDELWAAARRERPSVLLSVGHGIGVSRDCGDAVQRRRQGALSFGASGAIEGADFVGRGFLPGGIWLSIACFSAGTPETSDYYHWLDTLRRTGHAASGIGHVLDTLAHDRPFLAAIPKAVLADPNGPLAFVGHVDLAWTYSFFDLDDRPRRRPARLVSVLQALLSRHRAGVAVRKLMHAFAEVNTELTTLQDAQARVGGAIRDADRVRRAHLWMLRQDLAGYLLLGDPAVRLPIAGSDHDDIGAESQGASVACMEAAVIGILRGLGEEEAANRYGVDLDALRKHAAIYRAAGRDALAAALRGRRGL